MAIKTAVIWGTDQIDLNIIDQKLLQLVNDGVTDGNSNLVNRAVIRTWSTMEAAQGWINFLNSTTPPPVSTEIVQD